MVWIVASEHSRIEWFELVLTKIITGHPEKLTLFHFIWHCNITSIKTMRVFACSGILFWWLLWCVCSETTTTKLLYRPGYLPLYKKMMSLSVVKLYSLIEKRNNLLNINIKYSSQGPNLTFGTAPC